MREQSELNSRCDGKSRDWTLRAMTKHRWCSDRALFTPLATWPDPRPGVAAMPVTESVGRTDAAAGLPFAAVAFLSVRFGVTCSL